MAKKVRRVRKSRTPSDVNNTANQQSPIESAPRKRLNSTERFKQEYAYVLKDLRHILILAGAMFVLLIALNIVLQ